ncbi:MAG: YwbE family protein [Calditrichota bacterium]
MDGQIRENLVIGMRVAIVLKKDQRSGKLTEGIIDKILTSAPRHTRGIKVRLEDGSVGRVQQIIEWD